MVVERPARLHAPSVTPRRREATVIARPAKAKARYGQRMAWALFAFTFATTLLVLYLTEHAVVQRNQLALSTLERDVRDTEQKIKELDREISGLQLSRARGGFCPTRTVWSAPAPTLSW
ncbi:MAG: hypothetical protein QM758_16525 [Armatimonas sp.]